MFYVLAEISFGGFFHLGKNHGGNLFRLKRFLAIFKFHFNTRLGIFIYDLKWEHLEITLNLLVSEPVQKTSNTRNIHVIVCILLSADKALGVKNCSFRV